MPVVLALSGTNRTRLEERRPGHRQTDATCHTRACMAERRLGMKDPNKARIMRAMRALRALFPDAQSREVELRDDGMLVLSVDGEVVSLQGPMARCGTANLHGAHVTARSWCAGNRNIVTAQTGG